MPVDEPRASVNPYGSPVSARRAPPAPGSFKDRRTALTVFGILLILLGALFLLLAVVSVLGQAVSARMLEQEANYLQAVPSALFYALLAGAMVFVGFGSIGAKRWARNLALILAWSWLLTGLVSVLFMVFFVPRMLGAMPEMDQAPPGAQAMFLGIMFAVFALFFVLVPGVLVLFYRGANVKATVEAYDRGRDWTSACPLSILTLSLWMFVGALFAFASGVAMNGAMPFFGVIVTGAPGMLLYFVLAVVWGYAAWGLYKMSPLGWWLVFASSLFLGLSSLVTFLQVDLMTMYEQMGYSEQQLDAMRQIGALSGSETVWLTAAVFVPFLAYLVYLKKHFVTRPPASFRT